MDGQSLIQSLPAGWSPLVAVDVTPGGVALTQPAVLTLPAPAGAPAASQLTPVQWDPEEQAWRVLSPPALTADSQKLVLPLVATGQVAILVPDLPPNQPPTPVVGQRLAGVSPAPLPGDLTAAISPSPQILVTSPDARSLVQVHAQSGAFVPSGATLRLDETESYDFLAGTHLYPEPIAQDLVLYHFPEPAPAGPHAAVTLSPSRFFAIHELELGAIQLAVRPPPVPIGAPEGVAVDLTGSAVSTPEGQRLVIPRRAAADTLPVLLRELPAADFPPLLPAGVSLVAAVTVDFHGGRLVLPAALSITRPLDLAASATVLVGRLVEVGSVTYLSLVGPATSTPDGRLQFDGLLDEGRYAFVLAGDGLGFVTGGVTDEFGAPQGNMVASTDLSPLASVTTAEGRYFLAAPPGPVTVTVLDPATGNVVTGTATIPKSGGFASLDITLAPTSPRLLSLSPGDGAQAVPLITVVEATFSEALDPVSALDGLTLQGPGGRVDGLLNLTPDGRKLTFTPNQTLADSAVYTVTVAAALTDLAGNPLENPTVATFTTVDVTPPLRPPAGQISATIPDATGFSTVSATQGTVQPDWIVVIKNQTAGALTAVLPEADGSFSVRVPAAAGDKLVLLLQDTAGNQTEAPLGRFQNADGSVAVGAEGGVVEGSEGVAIEIPVGALPPGTVIKVDKATEADFPQPAPAGFPFVGGLKVEMSANAQQPLDLSVPAPADAKPDDLVIVARHVTWPKGQGWMMIDQAFLDNGKYTTKPPAAVAHRPPGVAKLLLQALPPPPQTPGLLGPGQVAFLRVAGDCMSYVSVEWNIQFEFVMIPTTTPFVFLPAFTVGFAAAVFPWTCNTPLEIELRDPNTDEVIQRLSQTTPAKRGANVGAFTTDAKAPPRIIQHNLYSGFQQDQLRIYFSKQMISETVTGGLQVTDQFGETIAGLAAMEEDDSLLVFTPTLPFQMGIQYVVEINDAKDALGEKELQMAEPLRFTPFVPRRWVELDEQVGAAPGTQAVAAIRDRVFAAHGTVDSPIQVLTVVDTGVVTTTAAVSETETISEPLVVGSSPTGLYRLRAMTAIPDVFATIRSGKIEAIPLFTPTLTASEVTTIVTALENGAIIPALIDQFDNFDDEPNADGSAKSLSQQTRLIRKAVVTVKDAGASWLIENRNNVYLLEKVDAETLRVLVGRDLLAILGTTEPLEGGLELLELWDVTACTKPYALGAEAMARKNCVNPAAMTFSRKVLADPKNVVGRFVPNNDKILRELGVPTQLAVLHDRTADVAVVYIVVAGIGLQAIDVTKAANMPNPLFTDPAPTGLRRGRFTDVAVLKNLVLATEAKGASHEPRQLLLTVLSGQLTDFLSLPDDERKPLEPVAFGNVLAVAAAPNVAYEMDGDGNLGAAENVDADGLPPTGTAAIDEFYDLAFVATGPIVGGESALWVVDLNAYTDFAENRFSKEASGPRVVAGIPLPISARSVQFDPTRKFAYVEVSGEGLYVLDLRGLAADLRAVQSLDGTQAPAARNDNHDDRDNRIAGIYPLSGIGNRAEIAVSFDPKRPIAYLHDFNAGVELVQVCNTCEELLLDFNGKDTFIDQAKTPKPASQPGQTTDGNKENEKAGALQAEKRILLSLLEGASISVTQLVPGLGPDDFYMLEQGSGGCFWTRQFDGNPTAACKSFNPGSSDHDFEVFFPAQYIKRAQDVLDEYVRNPPPEKAPLLKKLDDLSFYAMPREPFESALLLNSPPMNKEGDTAGDLGMGRQTLLLLWLLTAGGYAQLPDYRGWEQAPNLDSLLDCLKQNKAYDNQAKQCSSVPLYPGEPTGIPRLEGYEWGVLQEYNIYKTGALVRIAGSCDFAGKKDETDSKFVAPEINEDVDPNHPDRAFDDTYAFNSQCKSQLRTIAKSAIRTVLARLLADDRGNALVLGSRLITPTAGGPAQAVPVSRAAVQTGKFCLTELGINGNSGAPPTDASAYVDKPCDGFEEFVASMAIESVRRGVPVFQPTDLPMIWTFWCIKVWDGCTVNGKSAVPITNEEQAVAFVESAIAFIERVQRESQPVYAQTIISETLTVTQLMATLPQTMTSYPFIKDICRACETITGDPFLDSSTRADLRECNLVSVQKKINGKHPEHIGELDGQYLLFPEKNQLNELKSDLGVKNYALYNLRVRASNISANDLYSVTVALYAGDGKDVATYERMTEYDLPYLPAGGRTLVDVKTVTKPKKDPNTSPPTPEPSRCDDIPLQESEPYPGTSKPTSDVNLFPALFIISNTVEALGSGPESFRGISFFIDPEQEYLELDKTNNQADLFYYVMEGYDSQTPPAPPARPPLVIGAVESGAICRVNTPPLDIDLTIVPGTDPAAGGGQYLSVPIYSDTTLRIEIANRSSQPVRNARITLDGEEVVANVTIEANGNLSRTVSFVPAEARSYQFIAQVVGNDPDGNSVGPVDASAALNATRDRKAFDITLYDASPLSKLEHPFSRWNLHHDVDTGRELPVVGAVTDGEALLRIDVAGLEPSEPVSVTLKDLDIPAATAGFGELELVDAEGRVITSGLEIVVNTPADLGAGSVVRYRPPSGFVRPEYHLRDAFVHATARVPRRERQVEVTFDQWLTGVSSQRILLKRPPVFLFHGLGGDPTVWNKFRPIVPVTGVNLRNTQYVPGYDGRFMVFAAGSSPTVLPVTVEAENNYFRFRGALQNPDLKDYAVAGVDVVANSMGGLITREIARQFVQRLKLPVPFHKLITIGTPHLGSPVADNVVAMRDVDLLEGLDFDPLSLSLDDPKAQVPGVLVKMLSNRCALALQLLGSAGRRIMPALDLYSGAVDDMRTNSPAIGQLQAAGILIPSHYIIGQINNSSLAARIFNDGSATPSEIFEMWTALGMLCNWTPDRTTVEATVQQRSSLSAVRLVAALFGGNYRQAFEMIKNILDTQNDPPQPLLPEGNDRVVPVASQQGEMQNLARASTMVIDATDHLDIKETNVEEFQDNSVEMCNQYIHNWWGTPVHEPPRSLNDKNNVPCQVVFLLESSTESPLFCKPDETCDSGLAQLAGPSLADVPGGVTANQPRQRAPAAGGTGDSLQALAPLQVTVAEATAVTIAELSFVTPLPGAIVQPGQPVNVQVAAPAGVQVTDLTVGFDLAGGSIDLATLTAVVTTPIAAVGPQTITALGSDATGNLYFATREVWVNPGLLDRVVVAAPSLLAQSGQLLQVRVNGAYADGVVRDITAAAAGTAYTTTNPAVIDVTPDGWLQAKGNGVATLRVVNRNPVSGRAVTGSQRVEVQIPAGDENGIPIAAATVTPTVATESVVYLSAGGSSDPDGDPLSFRWEQTGGRLVVLVDANTAQPGFIAPLVTAPELLTFRLWVRDDRGAAALPVQVRVTVEP